MRKKSDFVSLGIFTRILSGTALSALILTAPAHSFAAGCVPSPDYWFDFTVNVDPQTLPAGVTLQRNGRYHGTQLYPVNATSTPFIINPPGPGRPASSPNFPMVKLISGQEYKCDASTQRCDELMDTSKPNAQLSVPEVFDAIMAGWVIKDDRPANVEIPKPQPFHFTALYGDKEVTVSGTVSFALNPKYNSKLGVISEAWCKQENAKKP